ncbi:senescence-associated protein OSA15, chloroplastic isoform X3 [Phragmites australis]|uniref:senescence-associated protein OSA15, chloroplastic isoform X3 n=1 Tax=Phragmites australis TaxID=29695 RepID=UPI002D76C33F|nr:senescence-associated protein OSA15, chloroplastic isoform X3 [Phragmites australis]
MASNMYGTVAACRVCYSDQYGMPQKLKGLGLTFLNCVPQKLEVRRWINGYHLVFRLCPNDRHWQTNGKSNCSLVRQGCNVRCHSYGSHNSSETKDSKISEDCTNPYRDFEQHSRGSSQFPDDQVASKKKSAYASQGLADACKFVYNDAKFVNERAQSDILLLSRGITRLNKRACQDVAVLGLGFLKLDARARKDTQKIDHSVKERAACLNDFARALKERAESDLKKAADQHWSDGALEADLRRANLVVKRRAMEDAFMALKEAYWSMASAFSEADGIDYTDPEELELLVATLIDLDAMDGKRSVSLISECSSSPDVNTRKALANALATAPSMWTLGNAGMGALQRLAQDSNYAVARAASRAIDELKKQWELEEGDSLRFVMNQNLAAEKTDDDNSGADDTT